MACDLKETNQIIFYLSGIEHTVNVQDVTPQTTLNTYLRKNLHLKGTKNMCLEGGCGACIVSVRRTNPETKKEELLAVNSCLISILSCHGWKVETVEGIGNPLKNYHVVQQTLANFNGTQCGFCSPGMVMNMYSLYESGKLTMKDVENSFGGNICRCTGYRPILSAFKSLCVDASPDLLGKYPDIEDIKSCAKEKCEMKCEFPCSKNQYILYFNNVDSSKWIKVFTIKDLLKTLDAFGESNYRLVSGNTGKGVFKIVTPPDVWIDILNVTELTSHELQKDKLILGGNMSLTNTMKLFIDTSKKNPGFWYLKNLADHIDLIANVPVRNFGSLAGNLMMKNQNNQFQSDVFLIFETVGALITIVSSDGSAVTKCPKDFMTFDMKKKIIKNFILPSLDQKVYKYSSYKIMPRSQNAHALVNAGFLYKINKNKIENASIVFGSINPRFVHATKTEQYLKGKCLFDNKVIQDALDILSGELVPEDAPPEPNPEFRRQLALALFYKGILSVAPEDKLSPKIKSGAQILERPVSSGTQDFETNESLYPLTQAIPKIEALAQTSGQAEYVEDIPESPNQLFASFVLSDSPAGSTIIDINASNALAAKNIVAFYGKNDIPGQNNFVPFEGGFKEEIFCSGIIQYYHQPVGIVVGKTQEDVDKAVLLVTVNYRLPNSPPLLNVKQVLEKNAKSKIIPEQDVIPRRKGTNIKHEIQGSVELGCQYHFHMEKQCCKVVPTEDGLDVFPATQYMDLAQFSIARMLLIPSNKINVTVRRCGGAFGAKITRSALISCAAALAAWKLRKPVNMSLSLQTNMELIGKRCPFYCVYKVGVDDKGVLQYLDADLYSDVGQGGNEKIITECLELFMSNYDSDTFNLSLNTVRTDSHANTWCRAPGTTEALCAIESIMDHIAYTVNADPINVRLANLKKEEQQNLTKYINDMKQWADIDKRKQDISNFNKANRWKKKGISVVPMAYKFVNYGPFMAMVTIYQDDGSVAVSHGGTEIGQGINTKVAQVCAYKLGIPLDQVSIKPSNNFVGANAFPTGGSVTSESICYSVMQACDELLQRIEPYKKKLPKGTWQQVIKACQADSVNLSAIGKFSAKMPDVSSYTIYGVCATEVLLDVLTGQFMITRVDLIEDAGNSISPLIDIGQVEGAFIMGLGYFISEDIITDKNGKILTNNTWTYKPPGPKDIPVDFRVKFPKNNPNPVGVLKSKATAEPPLCLTVTIPLAVRNAVASARCDSDKKQSPYYLIEGPSSFENTFMNSLNNYKQYVL